jgi:hypothetical protein
MQLALEYRIPAMLPRLTAADLQVEHIPLETGQALMRALDELASTGFPVLDRLFPGIEGGYDLEAYVRWFEGLEPGVSHLRLHPSVPGYDLEAITRSAPRRIADYKVGLQPAFKARVAEQGIHFIGYRCLRDLIRGV